MLGATHLVVHNGGHEGHRAAVRELMSQIATKALSKGDKWGIRKVRELQLRILQELRKGTPLDPLEGQPNNLQSIWEDALRVISLE